MTNALARPRKRFFLEMFTRDISLQDCILDLIDNSVDSYIRHSKNEDVVASILADGVAAPSRRGLIEISVSKHRITVQDDCGGIETQDALDDVFCFGHDESHLPGRLGVYGIGLKRAMFKVGNHVVVESSTKQSSFKVDFKVDEWAKKDDELSDWVIPIEVRNRSAGPSGTRIVFDDLREDVSNRLQDSSFVAALHKAIAQTYAFFLARHLRIKLNDQSIEGTPVAIGESQKLKAATKSLKLQTSVRARLIAGLAPQGEWKQDTGGWYVLCNGRVVLSADKSDVTGWGGKGPAYHTKFRGFVGILLLESSDSLALPWTTTKRGLNRESPVYQAALVEMVAIARPVLTFLSNMYPGESPESSPERDVAKSAKGVEVLQVASRPTAVFSARLSRKTVETIKVQFDVKKSEIERVRRHHRDSGLAGTKIARIALDYYLKMECSQ